MIRTWNDVLAVLAHRVDVNKNTGVVRLVNAGEAVGRGSLGRGSAGNVDLSAFHVKLSSSTGAGTVKCDHLGTEEVLAVGQAVGDLDRLLALVVDNFGGTPDSVAVAIMLDLEPN